MRFREAVVMALLLLAGDAIAAPAVVLTWEPMPGAAGYDIEISDDPAFASTVIASPAASPTYEWRTLPDRIYFWRVRCRYSFGRSGEWSAIRTIPRAVFPVTLRGPKPGEEIVCAESCRIVLSFTGSPALAEYRVELTRDADTEFLAPTLDVRVKTESVEWIPDDTGEYRWRVSAVDLLGRPVPAAGTQRLVVSRPRPTPTPAPVVIAGPPITDLVALLDQTLPHAPADTQPLAIGDPSVAVPAASTAVPGAPLETHRLRPSVATGAGWRSNFARATDVTPVVSVSQHLRGPFNAGVDVSSFRVDERLPDRRRATADVAEAGFRAGIGKSLDGRIDVSFHAGPVLQLVRARVGEAAEVGATAAAGGGVQVGGPLGSASWFVSADVRQGRWVGKHASLSTGGALVAAGVRFR